jgi:hypothetical protein
MARNLVALRTRGERWGTGVPAQWFELRPAKTTGWPQSNGNTILSRIIRPSSGAINQDNVTIGYWVSSSDNTTTGVGFSSTTATLSWFHRRNTSTASILGNVDTNFPISLCVVTANDYSTIYENGWRHSGASSVNNNTDFSSVPVDNGIYGGGQTISDKFIACMWNRALSQNEVVSMYADPYQFLTR